MCEPTLSDNPAPSRFDRGFAAGRPQTRSRITAIPCPTPMHIVHRA
jgi:hypothetical protein